MLNSRCYRNACHDFASSPLKNRKVLRVICRWRSVCAGATFHVGAKKRFEMRWQCVVRATSNRSKLHGPASSVGDFSNGARGTMPPAARSAGGGCDGSFSWLRRRGSAKTGASRFISLEADLGLCGVRDRMRRSVPTAGRLTASAVGLTGRLWFQQPEARKFAALRLG